jgi:hypothetical protein
MVDGDRLAMGFIYEVVHPKEKIRATYQDKKIYISLIIDGTSNYISLYM